MEEIGNNHFPKTSPAKLTISLVAQSARMLLRTPFTATVVASAAALSMLLLLPAAEGVGDEMKAACEMWSKLENKTLPLQNEGHANCTTNDECTGFNCNGIYQGKELSFGMRVLPCQSTPGIEIYGHAPQVNSKNFSHIFNHKELYDVPGELLNMSMMHGHGEEKQNKAGPPPIQGKLEVTLERNPGGKTMTMGLTAKGCITNVGCIFSSPVFNHTEIPVPECKSSPPQEISVNTVCSVNDLNACGKNQACVQEDGGDSGQGLCECLSGFATQDDGTCLSKRDDELATEKERATLQSARQPKSHDPTGLPITSGDGEENPGAAEEEGGGSAVAGVVIFLIVVAVVGVGAFVILRTRLAPRLRARLTNTPYGDIVGGPGIGGFGTGGRSDPTQNVIA